MEIGVSHKASVDEEKLVRAFLAGTFGASDETGDVGDGGLYFDAQQILVGFFPENMHDTLPQPCRGQIQ